MSNVKFSPLKYTKITADDEEANCIRCYNQDICKDGKLCGPKFGWRLYVRYEPIAQKNN